jgi:hypothetical protein
VTQLTACSKLIESISRGEQAPRLCFWRQLCRRWLRPEPEGRRRCDLSRISWISGDAVGILNFTRTARVHMIDNASCHLVSGGAKEIIVTVGSNELIERVGIRCCQRAAGGLDVEEPQRRLAGRYKLRFAIEFYQHLSATA